MLSAAVNVLWCRREKKLSDDAKKNNIGVATAEDSSKNTNIY